MNTLLIVDSSMYATLKGAGWIILLLSINFAGTLSQKPRKAVRLLKGKVDLGQTLLSSSLINRNIDFEVEGCQTLLLNSVPEKKIHFSDVLETNESVLLENSVAVESIVSDVFVANKIL